MIIITNITMGNTSQCTEYVDHEDDNGTDLSVSPEITVKMTMIMMMMIMMMAPISQPRDHGDDDHDNDGDDYNYGTNLSASPEIMVPLLARPALNKPLDWGDKRWWNTDLVIRSFFIKCDDLDEYFL